MIPEIRNHSYQQRLKDLKLISHIQRRLRGQLIEVFKYLNRFNNVSPITIIIIIIIIIKKDWQCKAGRERLTPYQSKDPSPTLPTYRGKEEKGKIVEDKKGESN